MRCALLVCCCLLAFPLSGASPAMPERVFVDRDSQTAFRYPASLRHAHACADLVLDRHGYLRAMVKRRKQRRDPSDDQGAPRCPPYAIRHISLTDDELPETIAAVDGVAVLEHLLGSAVSDPQPFDYYEQAADRPHAPPQRPQRDPVTGLTARWDGGTALLLRHRGRYSGVLTGKDLNTQAAERARRSFEIMLPDRAGVPATWAARIGSEGKVYRPSDNTCASLHRAVRSKQWDQAWEFETRHYRMSGTAIPSDLAKMARHLDALQDALRVWLPLDADPTEKFEVYLLHTQKEFSRWAARLGTAVQRNPSGANQSSLQGFYSRGHRAVLSFTERVRNNHGTPHLRLSHEAVHQYLHSHAHNSLPQWFDEGMAVLFEGGRERGDRFLLKPPATRLVYLKLYYRQHGAPITPFEVYTQQRLALHVHQYAEVYAMLHIILSQGDEGIARLQRYWQALRQRRKSGAALVYDHLIDHYHDADQSHKQTLQRWATAVERHVRSGAAKSSLTIEIGR